MKYLLHGKFQAKAGKADELAAVLLEASALVSACRGCRLYMVGKDEKDPDAVYVTEIWDTKEDHDNSLRAHGVSQLILKGIPFIDGAPQKGQELRLFGGFGV